MSRCKHPKTTLENPIFVKIYAHEGHFTFDIYSERPCRVDYGTILFKFLLTGALSQAEPKPSKTDQGGKVPIKHLPLLPAPSYNATTIVVLRLVTPISTHFHLTPPGETGPTEQKPNKGSRDGSEQA